MAAAEAEAGDCTALRTHDPNEPGPSYTTTTPTTTTTTATATAKDSCLSPLSPDQPQTSSGNGSHKPKKTQRVTIKDTNPTYHRSTSATKDVIISVREKHGSFRAAVPCMPTPVALACCLLNILAPGTGTLVSAFACFCCGYSEVRPYVAFFWNFLAAFLQMITFVFIIGWIWSIIWGMTFMSLATEYEYVRQIRQGKHHAAVLRSDSARSA